MKQSEPMHQPLVIRWLCGLLRAPNLQWSPRGPDCDMEDTSSVSQLDVCGQGSPQTADCEEPRRTVYSSDTMGVFSPLAPLDDREHAAGSGKECLCPRERS